MPSVTTPTAEFVELCESLFGGLADPTALWESVSKMNPGPSDVHIMGALRPTGRRRAVKTNVGKMSLGVLREGRLSGLRMMTHRHDPQLKAILAGGKKAKGARQAQAADRAVAGTVPASPRQVTQAGAPRAMTPPKTVAGDPKPAVATPAAAAAAAPALSRQDAAVADGAKARTGLNQFLSTKTGKIVATGAVGTTAVAANHRGKRSAYASVDPYAKRDTGVPDDRTKRRVTAGLSAVGATAGAYGLGVGVHDMRSKGKEAGAKGIRNIVRTGFKAQKTHMKVLVPLEVAGLGGEVMATRILHADSKKPVTKNVNDVQWGGEFSKFDEDKRLAFGWASVVKVNGEPVVDRQGDYIGIGDIEDAAYVYVEKSRVGGDMHRRVGGKDLAGEDRPHHVADLVESMVFTPEKIAKMGLPDDFPVGWWVGFKVHDDASWTEVKEGRRTGFSIHGKGIRKEVDYDSILEN